MRSLVGWVSLGVLMVFVAGCDVPTVALPTPSRSDWGRFEGEVVASWDADGRLMTLRDDFAYIDPTGKRWLAPAGTVVDGASIPRLFWTVIGSPFSGRYRNASVVHDIECDEMREPWEDVHRMFYEACRAGGVEEAQAKVMYYAVYHFGPRWELIAENVVEQMIGADGQLLEREVTVQHVVRIDPPPPTPEELEQVRAYIVEDDPEPEALERFSRDSLHRRPSRGRRDFTPRTDAEGNPGTPSRETPSRETPSWRERPEANAARPGDRSARTDGQTPSRRPTGTEMRVPPISQETVEWVSEIVQQHIDRQVGTPRPARYQVERFRSGYRVLVEFLHEDDLGQLVPYEGGTSTARVSRDGQVLEVVSGFQSPERTETRDNRRP